MDFSFDIFQIYRQYCDITLRAIAEQCEGYSLDDELQKARISREALAQLWKEAESKISPRILSSTLIVKRRSLESLNLLTILQELISNVAAVPILDEVYKLMSSLGLMAEFSEFSRFYDFVFFICRENGQKNITVSRAVMAWRLVLSGRFRLLNQWCSFVEKNQKYNISEDTWRQVLAFSRCVHENLEGYDPTGAWPILIDEFVEYMYRVRGSHSNLFCNCGNLEPEQGENTSTGLTNVPGSKRRLGESPSSYPNFKKKLYSFGNSATWGQNQVNSGGDDCTGIVKHGSPLDCAKSPCSVEGCLSKGFAGLLSGQSCLKFDQDRRVSYT